MVVIRAGLVVSERHETPWALVWGLTYSTHIQIKLLIAVACAVDFPIHRCQRDRGLVVGVGVGGDVCQDLATAQVLRVLSVRGHRGWSAQKGEIKSSHLLESAQKCDLLAVLWCAADVHAGGLQAAGHDII